MTKPFDQHQRAIARWQPSAPLFGRTLWRALVRGAVVRDAEEKRGRAPVTAVVTTVPVTANGWQGFLIRRAPSPQRIRAGTEVFAPANQRGDQ